MADDLSGPTAVYDRTVDIRARTDDGRPDRSRERWCWSAKAYFTSTALTVSVTVGVTICTR